MYITHGSFRWADFRALNAYISALGDQRIVGTDLWQVQRIISAYNLNAFSKFMRIQGEAPTSWTLSKCRVYLIHINIIYTTTTQCGFQAKIIIYRTRKIIRHNDVTSFAHNYRRIIYYHSRLISIVRCA